MIEEVNCFLRQKFGIAAEKSAIKAYNKEEWKKFCLENKIADAEGAYMPRSMQAHFLEESRFGMQNLFHEYFGHGLFVEHALEGQALHSLELKMMEEEQAARIKTAEELGNFRKNSKTHNALKIHHDANLPLYEGFAMWMEFYLSGMTTSLEGFFRKMEMLPKEARMLCSQFIDYSVEYGEYALLYSSGLPKHYDNAILSSILQKLLKDDFNSIELALLYGSRKPYSDIDVFIVSDKVNCSFRGWIDIYAVPKETFKDLISKKDISITDPIFSGELIQGSKAYLGAAKRTLLEEAITSGMIAFHRQHSEKAKMLAEHYPKESKEYKTAMRYSKSYLLNAKEMENGRKPLTLAQLKLYYPDAF